MVSNAHTNSMEGSNIVRRVAGSCKIQIKIILTILTFILIFFKVLLNFLFAPALKEPSRESG